ncbi:MAG: glycosyltransferase family 39 protein [Chloroflexi bacterium]|nr:glycosyltransferase family 39 protein [Chloroflexota bacterium]
MLGYVLLVGFLALRLPPLAGPNEALHYEYVALLRQTGRLPDLSTSYRPDERHQPPVYYSLAALLSLPFATPQLDSELSPNPHFPGTLRGSGNLNPFIHLTPTNAPVVYAGRIASMLFGVLAMVSLYAAARQTLPQSVSLLAVAVMAFQPSFLHLSATMNNDLAVTAVATLLTAYTTYLIIQKKSARYYLGWGLLFGLALLTKASAIFLLLTLPVACWTVWRRTRSVWQTLQAGLWGGVGFVPLVGGWLLFNHERSGDALGLAPSVPLGQILTLRPADLGLLLAHLVELFRSFWLDWSPGILGYGPGWLYGMAAALLLFALLGWLRPTRVLVQPTAVVLVHVIWIGALATAFLAVKTVMIRDVGFLVPEGRWLLPAWPSLAWLVAVGWARWWGEHERKMSGLATAVPPLTALLLSLFFLPQLYPQARRLTALTQIPATTTSANLLYNGQLALTAVETNPIHLGETARATLYWRATQTPNADYTVTVQLLTLEAGQWTKLAETRSFPGGGHNPTLDWREGDMYRDEVILRADGAISGPTAAWLGVWLDDNGTNVQAKQNGQITDWPLAMPVVVRPASPIPLPETAFNAPVQFADLFDLAAITQEVVGDEWLVTLWWQARQAITADYVVFVHVLDDAGNLVAQSDSSPANGSSPTYIWQPGDVIRDQHRLPRQTAVKPSLLIGVYDRATTQRLPIYHAGVPQPDNVWRYTPTESR